MNFTGNNQTFNIGSGVNAIVTGTGDTINISSGATVTIYGSTSANSNETINFLGAGSTVTANAGVATFNLNGYAESITIANTYGFWDTLNGSHSTFTIGQNSLVNISGSSNTVSLDAQSHLGILAGSTNNTTTVIGSYAVVNDWGTSNGTKLMQSNDIATLYSTGSWADSYASGDEVDLRGNSENSAVNGTGSWTNTFGTSDHVWLNAGYDSSEAFSGANNNTITSNAANDSSKLLGNSDTAIVYGTNSWADSYSSSDEVDLRGSSENSAVNGTGSWTNSFGANNNIWLNAASDSSEAFQGADGNVITSNANNDGVKLLGAFDITYVHGTSGSWADSYGSSDEVDLLGNNENSAVNGNGSWSNSSGQNDSVWLNGTNDASTAFATALNSQIIDNGAGDGIKQYGNYDVATVNGNNSWADEFGTSSSVYLNGQFENSALNGGSDTLILQGIKNNVWLNGNTESVGYASGESANTITSSGTSESIALGGANDKIFVNGGGTATGTFDAITATGATVTIDQVVNVTISGSSNAIVNNSGHLFINPIFASSATSNYETAAFLAINYFENNFSNNMVMNLDFAIYTGSSTFVADNTNTIDQYSFSYSTLKTALLNNATSAAQISAANALPSSNPFGSSAFYITNAEAQALGLSSYYSTASGTIVNGMNIDGLVNLNSKYSYDYTQTNIQSNQVDAVGALEHEISEVMGRVEFTTSSTTFLPSVEGLHIYTASGVVDSTPLTQGADAPYFSIDGGVTSLGAIGEQFSGGGDIADWTNASMNDPFGYSIYGEINQISAADIDQMETLGYNFI